MSKRMLMLVVVSMAMVLSGIARAVPLAPSGSVAVSGSPASPGVVLKDDLTPFEIHNAAGALLYKAVLQDRVDKLDANGKLEFSFWIRDIEPGLNGFVMSVERKSFSGFTTDVDFSTTSLGNVGPGNVKRTSDGSVLDYDFSGSPLYSSVGSSRRSWAQTDAEQYAKVGEYTIVLSGGWSVSIPGYAPVVPEPAGLGLLMLGGLGLLAGRRRR